MALGFMKNPEMLNGIAMGMWGDLGRVSAVSVAVEIPQASLSSRVHFSSCIPSRHNKSLRVITSVTRRKKAKETTRNEQEDAVEELPTSSACDLDFEDIKSQAEALAGSLDRSGFNETVKLFEGATGLGYLVAPVLKRTKRSEAALEFFQWTREHGFAHNTYTYNCMLASLVVERNADIQKLYEQMTEDGVVPDNESYNLVVKGLAKLNKVDEAREVLTRMVDEGYNPDVATCGIVVDKFCGLKRVGEVCELFQSLESNGVAIGILAHNAILKALMCSGNFDSGYKFSDIVVGGGSLPPVLAYKTMLDCLIKTGKTREASDVVADMIKKSVPDETTYTALISVLCKHNRTDEAMKVFDIMLEKDIAPNADAFTWLLAAHCRTRKLDMAYSLFVEMIRRGYGPSPHTYGLLLRCLCNSGKAYLAYEIHTSMRSQGNVPDENTYASLIYGSCSCGRIDQAKELFKELLESDKAQLDASIYNVLIEGLCRAAKVEEALELTADMVDRGCVPTLHTYNALLMGFFKANEHVKALQLLRAMEDKGFAPNTMIYNTFIDGLCKVGKIDEAQEFFNLSVEKGCVPDNVTYNALIRGLFGANRMEDAQKLYNEMVDKGYIADRSLRSLAFHNTAY